jgi:hypothetical protein
MGSPFARLNAWLHDEDSSGSSTEGGAAVNGQPLSPEAEAKLKAKEHALEEARAREEAKEAARRAVQAKQEARRQRRMLERQRAAAERSATLAAGEHQQKMAETLDDLSFALADGRTERVREVLQTLLSLEPSNEGWWALLLESSRADQRAAIAQSWQAACPASSRPDTALKRLAPVAPAPVRDESSLIARHEHLTQQLAALEQQCSHADRRLRQLQLSQQASETNLAKAEERLAGLQKDIAESERLRQARQRDVQSLNESIARKRAHEQAMQNAQMEHAALLTRIARLKANLPQG